MIRGDLRDRKRENVAACHCLYLDIDAKDYNSIEELEAAFDRFLADGGIPYPNLIVASGRGGWHVYWILGELLPPDEWQEYADALVNAGNCHRVKFDAGCTIDAARVLRLPGTWNHKVNHPCR